MAQLLDSTISGNLSISGTLNTNGSITTTNGIYGKLYESVSTVAAAGTTQGTGTQLDSANAIFRVTSGTGGVVLPIIANTGAQIIVFNDTTASINVYPPSSGYIDSGAQNASVPISANSQAMYVSTTTTLYETLRPVLVGANGISTTPGNGIVTIGLSSTVNLTTANITTGLYANGTLTAPSISFGAQTNTGIYLITTNSMGLSSNGNLVMNISQTSVNIFSTLNVSANIANVGNLLVTQNTFTGNLRITTLANTATLNVSANIANVGNLLVTQNTFTGNLSITTLANTATLNVSANIANVGNLLVTQNTFTGNLSVTTLAKISGNTINVGTTASISVNGFSRMTNGLLFQWGNVAATSSNTTVTFPAAFTALYQVTATTNQTSATGTGANVNCTPFIVTSNTTAFNVKTNSSTANTVNWMAIGI
jgi:hypothetical protein